MQHRHGNCGKCRAFSHGAAHHHYDEQVQHRFGCEDGIIPGQSVLNGADDGHCPDADGQGRADEGIDERLVLGVPGFDLQPLPQPLKRALNVQRFPDHCADGKAPDNQHRTAADDLSVLHREHTLHGAGNGDKQRAHTADLHQRILRALAQDASKQRPAHTACQNRGCVDDRSKPNHVLSLFFPDLPKFYCILLKMSTRRRDIDFPSGKQYTIF